MIFESVDFIFKLPNQFGLLAYIVEQHNNSWIAKAKKPKLAVWKFASCSWCQLSLLDCEDELLAIAETLEIAYFPKASSALKKGPYDLSLVEGSITTAHDAHRIHEVRKVSKTLVTIGACATAGGIQALRNFKDVGYRHKI